MEGEGFEPSKAEPTDLQSAPFDRSGTPPKLSRPFWAKKRLLSIRLPIFLPGHDLAIFTSLRVVIANDASAFY